MYTLKVAEIKRETDQTITLCFKQPGLRKIKYQAGQYLTLVFSINGRRYLRPYSFSSAPAVDLMLEVTIKRVPNGIVSNHIHDNIKIGDAIEVMNPMGDFICEKSQGHIVLWGVGSGITPLMSIAKQVLATTQQTYVSLIYGNRNNESTIFLDKIHSLQKEYSKRFVVRHFHTQLKINQNFNNIVEGRIDKERALKILDELSISNEGMHYICGPSGLKDSIKEALVIKDISLDAIMSEDFELVKNPNDIVEVQTQCIRLKYGEADFDLEIKKGKTILESALDAGIDLPYSCQTGSCSTCKGKLLQGEVKMIGLTKERDDLLPHEYLVCCTHPLSNNVYIEIG